MVCVSLCVITTIKTRYYVISPFFKPSSPERVTPTKVSNSLLLLVLKLLWVGVEVKGPWSRRDEKPLYNSFLHVVGGDLLSRDMCVWTVTTVQRVEIEFKEDEMKVISTKEKRTDC